MAEWSCVVAGGHVVDATGVRRADVAVGTDGLIAAVAPSIGVPAGVTVLDAGGCAVAPALVDLHAHLREPGGEEAETIASGTRAAALGGYSALVAMPNTEPCVDCAAVVRDVQEIARRDGVVEVALAGAITAGRRGERLSPMGEMAELGVRIFTDDGAGVEDAGIMRQALLYAGGLGVTLAQHCETRALSRGGVMRDGAWSAKLGLPGIPAAAEETMLARDLVLVAETRCRYHALHLSSARSAAMLAAAKVAGLPVSAEVTPHHLALDDSALETYDPLYKVNPPLGTREDASALRAAIVAGDVDALATDHAPHPRHAKELPLTEAAAGMLGLQSALAAAWSAICAGDADTAQPAETGDGVPRALVALLAAASWRPAAIAGLDARHGGPIVAGRPANICVFDWSASWSVEAAGIVSRSVNSPFIGRRLTGVVRHTIVGGRPVVVGTEPAP